MSFVSFDISALGATFFCYFVKISTFQLTIASHSTNKEQILASLFERFCSAVWITFTQN